MFESPKNEILIENFLIKESEKIHYYTEKLEEFKKKSES